MDDEKEIARQALYVYIRETLAKHPDLVGTATQAMTAGVEDAIKRMQELRSKTDMAFLVALSMVENPRSKSDEALNKTIAAAIYEPTASNIERQFLKRTGQSGGLKP